MDAILAPDGLLVSGLSLNPMQQRSVLARFIHRFTGQHTPEWVRKARAEGTVYPVQFRDDRDWLANTRFVVTARGDLDGRYGSCVSTPTWPFGKSMESAPALLAHAPAAE